MPDMLRDALAREPFQRGLLALFAELVRAQEGYGGLPMNVYVHRPAPNVEGGFVLAHR